MAQATMNKSDNNGSSATKQVDDHRTPTMTSKHDSPGQKRSSTNNNNKQQASTSQASSELNSSRPMVTVASSASNNESIPIANVNVKETVQVFNQIAALREKSTSSKPTSPTGNTRPMSDSNSASSNTAVALRSPDMLSRDSALESTGQFYKQRSIRATLAPQLETSDSASSVHKNGDQKHARSSHVNYGSSISSASTSDVTKSSSSSASNNHHQSEPQHNNDPALHHSRLASSGKTFDSSTAVASHPARQQRFNSTTATEHHHQQQKSSTKSASSSRSRTKDLEVPLPDSYDQSEQVTTNESYVSVLNHCFDDIEKFIIRLQQAVAAKRELYSRRKLHKSAHRSGYSTNDALKTGSSSMISASELAILNARAAGPNEDDYFEILSKFKLAFNLLAKLKGCIHEPNAPELVHFLFTPLAIVIESARNVTPTPVDPTLVNVPYLNRDALELLSNCCTSKESDLWLSLGPNWTQTIDIKILKASRLPNSFQPIFTDGWAPVITELELIGLVAPRTMSPSYVETNGGLLQGRDSSNGLDGSVDVSSGTDYHLDRSPPYTSKSSHRTTTNGSSKVASGALGYLGKKRHSPTHLHGKLSNSYDTPLHLVDDDPRFGVIDQDGMLQSSRHHRSANRVKRGSALEMANISSSHSIQRQQPLHNRSKSHSRRTDSASRFYITDPLQSSDCDLNQAAAGYLDGSEVVPVVADRIDPRRIDLMNSYGADYGGRSRHFSPLSSSSSKQEIQRDRLDSSSRQGFHHARSSHADHHPSRSGPYASGHNLPVMTPSSFEQMTEIERETMLLDLGPAQTEWFFELQARGAMIVRVLFTREANNEKELSVQRGELLEILDDSRKWWKARNINLQVAHVPLTIVARMNTYQTLDELLTGDPADFGPGAYLDPHRRDLSEPNYHYHNNGRQDDRQARRAVGAFRYF